MKVGFPCYTASFPCFFTTLEATRRISETVISQHKNLKIIQVHNNGYQNIVVSTNASGYIYYNSFMPIVSIEMREVNRKTQVSVLFELKKSTKVLITFFSMLALLFEVVLLVFWAMNQLVMPILLCFPLGLMILNYALSAVGLYFSSKGVFRILFATLTHEDTKCVLHVHKSKYIE